MTVLATYEYLQETIHAAISGVKRAPTKVPASIETAILPLVLTWPGVATWDEYTGDGLLRQLRTYLVEIYVLGIGEGTPVDQGFQECLPFLDRFASAYYANRSLGGNIEMIEWPISDSGIVAGPPLHKMGYWGIQFSLTAREKTS